MKIQHLMIVIFVAGVWSCKPGYEKSDSNSSFTRHIKFNHLYVVIDDTTYNYLFDSLKFLDDFSINSETKVDAGEESWTGKYVIGKNHYLEIFKPNGYEGSDFGDVGLGFMTNKIGTLDSLYSYWLTKLDSVTFDTRDFVDENGDTSSWFHYISIPNNDSLQIDPWLMENTRDHMISTGYTDNDLLGEIDYWDYIRHNRAGFFGTSPDSVKYEKLFDKINTLHLTLTEQELSRLRNCLNDFGFTEKEGTFSKDDFDIKYSVSLSKHFILQQIDFSLLDTLQDQDYSFRNLDFSVKGNRASLKFNYY